jgi:ABC-type amino acid transport substrate-binding protein
MTMTARHIIYIWALIVTIAAATTKAKNGVNAGGAGVTAGGGTTSAGTGVIGEGIVTREDREMSFNGAHFKIMTPEDPPFISVRERTFDPSSPLLPPEEWHGFVIDLIRATSSRADFTYELILPNVTYSYKEGYEALIEGRADVFWGLAYIDPKRLAKSFMTTPFWHSPLALVVPHQNNTGQGLSSINADFMEPFTRDLWFNILLLFIFAGIFYAVIEPMNQDDFTIAGIPNSLSNCLTEIFLLAKSTGGFFPMFFGHLFLSRQKTSNSNFNLKAAADNVVAANAQLQADKNRLILKRDAALMHFHNLADILFHSTYLGMCIITGANVWQPSSRGGKVFTLGVSMFAVILVSAYTANLAVFLANRPDTFLVSSLEDFRLRKHEGIKMCVQKDSAYLNNYLREHTEHKNIEYVEASGVADYMELMYNGECHGALADGLIVDYMQNGKWETSSDRNVIGEVSEICTKYQGLKLQRMNEADMEAGPLQYGVGFGGWNASADAKLQGVENEKRMSYWLTRLTADNTILIGYENSVRQGGCFSKQSVNTGTSKFSTINMSGAFAVVLCSAFIAIALHLLESMKTHRRRVLFDVRYALQRLTLKGNHVDALKARMSKRSVVQAFQKPGKPASLPSKWLVYYPPGANESLSDDDLHNVEVVTKKKNGYLRTMSWGTSTKNPTIGLISHVELGPSTQSGTPTTVVDVQLIRGAFQVMESSHDNIRSMSEKGIRLVDAGKKEDGARGVLYMYEAHANESLPRKGKELSDLRGTRSSILAGFWYTETSIESQYVHTGILHRMFHHHLGEHVEVKDVKYRSYQGDVSQSNHHYQLTRGRGKYRPAQVIKVAELTSTLDEIANILKGIAHEDLNSLEAERTIFRNVDPATIAFLESSSFDASKENELIRFNWPKLVEVVKKKWATEAGFRVRVHRVVLEFLKADFKLREIADEWSDDGVFLQAIDECADEGQHNATEFSQFQRHEEKFSLVMARFIKKYMRRHELSAKTSEVGTEETQVTSYIQEMFRCCSRKKSSRKSKKAGSKMMKQGTRRTSILQAASRPPTSGKITPGADVPTENISYRMRTILKWSTISNAVPQVVQVTQHSKNAEENCVTGAESVQAMRDEMGEMHEKLELLLQAATAKTQGPSSSSLLSPMVVT